MKVCPSCFSEFRDGTELCDACQVSLVSEQEGARLKALLPAPEPNGSSFVTAATSTDPFETEALVAAVREAGVAVFSRDRRRALVDVLVTPGANSFWEVLVPADAVAKAQAAIEVRRRELVSESADASRAAEEEEAATENHAVVGESENEELANQWAQKLSAAGISAVLRARQDVELDTTGRAEPAVTLVLVPSELAARAREVLRER